MNRRMRKEYQKTLFFMPQTMMFDVYNQHPKFEKWINRIVGLIFLLAAILGIVVGFHGPF
jgi:threonine/homoserine/homoserine lactone efflux protein